MEVIRRKEAKFDFEPAKYTSIPKVVFDMLVEPSSLTDDYSDVVIMFDDKESYVRDSVRYDIDPNRDVYVNNSGRIFCFLSDTVAKDVDGTTGTEKN